MFFSMCITSRLYGNSKSFQHGSIRNKTLQLKILGPPSSHASFSWVGVLDAFLASHVSLSQPPQGYLSY
jgi:hypothetical protein